MNRSRFLFDLLGPLGLFALVACSSTANIARNDADAGTDASTDSGPSTVDGGDGGRDASRPDANGGCIGENDVVCAAGGPCRVGSCNDGTPLSCMCEVGGILDKCTGACPQTTPGACTGYGGVACAADQGCVTGRCPDGSPVSCICQADGTFRQCTGGCPP